MRKHLLAACLLLPLPAAAQSQLIGSWSMVSAIQTENGQSKDYFGPHPLGQLMFGTDGRFSNLLLRSDLPRFKSNNRLAGTPEENTAVVSGSIAYFGTYVLSGDTLKMHIFGSTYPNWTNDDQTRTVHVTGDQLIWENAAASGGGSVKQIYERVK